MTYRMTSAQTYYQPEEGITYCDDCGRDLAYTEGEVYEDKNQDYCEACAKERELWYCPDCNKKYVFADIVQVFYDYTNRQGKIEKRLDFQCCKEHYREYMEEQQAE